MKPKLLFVDDRTKRIHYALENYPGYEVTIATCVPEALRQMSANDFDVISLDHDLTGCDFEDPDTPTCGMEIVRYIAKTGWPPQRNIPEFFVHSSNLFAAHLMQTTLNDLGYSVTYKPIRYNETNMQYDKDGLPK
jgi:CheY-like chemotaxis protein